MATSSIQYPTNHVTTGGTSSFTPDGSTSSFNVPHGLSTVIGHCVTRQLDPSGILIESTIVGSNIVVTYIAGPPPAGSAVLYNWLAIGL